MIDRPRKGATFARREALDPINLVSRIMGKYPTAGLDEVCRRVRAALADDALEYQEAFDNYCTRNHYAQLCKEERPTGSRKPRDKALAERRRLKVAKATVRELAKRALITLLPGTTMHDLWKLGGAAQKIGRRGDRRDIRTVYTISQLKETGFRVAQ